MAMNRGPNQMAYLTYYCCYSLIFIVILLIYAQVVNRFIVIPFWERYYHGPSIGRIIDTMAMIWPDFLAVVVASAIVLGPPAALCWIVARLIARRIRLWEWSLKAGE